MDNTRTQNARSSAKEMVRDLSSAGFSHRRIAAWIGHVGHDTVAGWACGLSPYPHHHERLAELHGYLAA